MKILLIEPDKILAGNYKDALEQSGHNVSWRPSAQSAIHQADSERADIVILELQLPSHNGIEFLYEFRSYPEWQDIPVIVLSLVPEESVTGGAKLFEQLGVARFLYKPQTKLRQLVSVVNYLEPAVV